MRWGLGSKHHQRETQHPQEPEQEQQESKGGKSKAAFSSFSPLAWLSKITAKNNAAAAKPKHAPPAAKNAAGGFPYSCFHKRAGPGPTSQSSPAESLPAAVAPDIAPRRLSVGKDDAEAAATAARQPYRRRHYSVGGDRDLLSLSHLIPFSRAASPQSAPAPVPDPTLTPMPPLPSDKDEEKRRRSRRPRRRGAERRSFSGRTPGARVAVAVRVRSPCRAAAAPATAVSELERFAVVRRTRDPQREFRQSMVEMIASKRIGRPEELETLLACYISLNADEHHDCIVKVFRQVWFELNPARIAVAAPTRS